MNRLLTDLEIEISAYAEDEGISFHAIAQRFGVSPTYIYRIEKREFDLVPIRVQAQVAQELGLDYELELSSEPGSINPPTVKLVAYKLEPELEISDDAK